jgi:hypothetical protein
MAHALFASLVLLMAEVTKKKRKEEAYPWKAGAISGHITNLKQSIWRLSISMMQADNNI